MSERPVLRVVSGDATPEELAAIVAAVAAAAPDAEAAPGPRTTSLWARLTNVPVVNGLWAAREYALPSVRGAFAPGPDGWRTSFWPR